MEMIVLDQTRPEIGLPVVKVIVPGPAAFLGAVRARAAVRRARPAGMAARADPGRGN